MTITSILHTLRTGAGLALAALLALPAPGQAQLGPAEATYGEYGEAAAPADGYATGYSYFKEVDGSATLFQGSGDEREDAEINRPILAGDRVYTTPQGRLEILLSDNNVLRLDGDTEVVFESLAYSPESTDTSTSLRLLQGNLQLVTFDGAPGDELPRVFTSNATVFVQRAGTYRVTAGRRDWSSAVVRDGFAEIASETGSVVARSGDEVSVEGSSRPRVEVVAAGGLDGLERWGQELERGIPDEGYVDDSLRYASSQLDDYGSWVRVEGRNAWRPRAADDWRPYWKGRWVYTPAGMTWVSYEPWGWVPYHYGTWDYSPGYGWVWFPGSRFAPAYVNWYWGDGYAGWVPSGFYANFYSSHYGARFGLGFGVYGWAGGAWDAFYNWTFCPVTYLGYRRQSDYLYTGRSLHNRVGWREVPRGIITTDTRGLTPRHWRDREEVEQVLVDRGARQGRNLPDVTSYIAREPELPREVQRRVAVPEPAVQDRARRAVARPGTDGSRGATASRGGVGTVTDVDRRATVDNRRVTGGTATGETTRTRPGDSVRRSTESNGTTRGTATSSTGRDAARNDSARRPVTVAPRSDGNGSDGNGSAGTADRGTARSTRDTGTATPARPRSEVRRPTAVTPRSAPNYPDRGRADTRTSAPATPSRDDARSSSSARNGEPVRRSAPPATTSTQRRGSTSTVQERPERGRGDTSSSTSTRSNTSTRSPSTPPARVERGRTETSRSTAGTVQRSTPPRTSSANRSGSSARGGSSDESSRSSARSSSTARSNAGSGNQGSARGSSGKSESASSARSSDSGSSSSAKKSSSRGNRSRSSGRAQGGQSGNGGG